MKNVALVLAFALLATVSVAISASAAEISQAASANPTAPATPATEPPVLGTPAPIFDGPKPPLIPRCYTVDGTSCSSSGATMACTDVCHNALSCTCRNIYAPPYYIIVTGHYWDCDDEC